MKALELMRTHVTKTTPDATLSEAVDLMDIYHTGELPVVDETGVLCGFLTEGDVMRAFLNSVTEWMEEGEPNFDAYRIAREKRVGEIMSAPAIFVQETDEVRVAAKLMMAKSLKRIPVVTEENRVVGTLTRIDIIQAVFEENL